LAPVAGFFIHWRRFRLLPYNPHYAGVVADTFIVPYANTRCRQSRSPA